MGSISQEFNIVYTQNSGNFVVFIEDVNWKPEEYIEDGREFFFGNQTPKLDPCVAFYSSILRSMGSLLRFQPQPHNYVYGGTLLKLPFIDSMRVPSKNGDFWGVQDRAYVPQVSFQLDKILENSYFYQQSITGRDAGI